MLWGGSQVLAQDEAGEDYLFFPETYHTIEGEFLDFYQSFPNPQLVFGYPITEAFPRQSDNKLVQYFERARFELHEDNPEELRVKLTNLGEIFHTRTTEFPAQGNVPGCDFFPESGKYVCYAFLEFFNANGGAAQFGYPISNFEIRDERIVQYFQRARFEWHPELPKGQKVQLTDLGRRYFNLLGEDPVELRPYQDNGNPRPQQLVQKLQVRAFLQHAATHQDGKQTITVVVQDQNLMPVVGAKVAIFIIYPNGESERKSDLATDKNGVTRYSFSFEDQSIGFAKVIAEASYEELKEELKQATTTSFLIWH
jgi:hypothetical protein